MKRTLEPKAKQLRGAALRERIIAVTREDVSSHEERDSKRASLAEIAALVPCSRMTLNKYKGLVVEELEKDGMRTISRTGDIEKSELVERIVSLMRDNDALKKELDAIREHHVDLYGRMHRSSAQLSEIARSVLSESAGGATVCPCCGRDRRNDQGDSVVKLSAHRRKT